jgi:hypothetical protein
MNVVPPVEVNVLRVAVAMASEQSARSAPGGEKDRADAEGNQHEPHGELGRFRETRRHLPTQQEEDPPGREQR